jgi:hypothetical protein
LRALSLRGNPSSTRFELRNDSQNPPIIRIHIKPVIPGETDECYAKFLSIPYCQFSRCGNAYSYWETYEEHLLRGGVRLSARSQQNTFRNLYPVLDAQPYKLVYNITKLPRHYTISGSAKSEEHNPLSYCPLIPSKVPTLTPKL